MIFYSLEAEKSNMKNVYLKFNFMRNILLSVLLLSISTNAFCQIAKDQYPKPFQIDYGTKKIEVIQNMKTLGFPRNKEYVGLIYSPVKFMGNENASVSFEFNLSEQMINCEIFCNFDDMMSAYLWYDDTIKKLLEKYKNGEKDQHTEYTEEYKNKTDSLKFGELLKGIKEGKIFEHTDIKFKNNNHNILIHFEITKFESVRVSFNDLTMQELNEKDINKKNSNDF